MSDIINLRQFKKRKTRSEKEQLADANRILFGRTKTEKTFAKNQAEKTVSFLEQNRLEPRNNKPDNTSNDDDTL